MRYPDFEPDRMRPVWGDEEINQYIGAKLERVGKEEKRHIHETINKAVIDAFASLEFLVVRNGLLINIEHEREVVLKAATLHTMLYSISCRGDYNSLEETMKFAGCLIGREFADTVIKVMIADDKLLNYSGFLKLWSRLDSRAAWGNFTDVVFDDDNATCHFKIENPLSSYAGPYASRELLQCFLRGYLLGVIDEGFRRISWLYSKCRAYKLPNNDYAAKDVLLKQQHPNIYVTVELRVPEFSVAFGEVFEFIYSRNTDVSLLRKAIEFLVKELVGVSQGDHESMIVCLKRMRDEQWNVSFERIIKVYEGCSRAMHREFDPDDRTKLDELYYGTRFWMNEIGICGPSKSQLKSFRRKYNYGAESKPPPAPRGE